MKYRDICTCTAVEHPSKSADRPPKNNPNITAAVHMQKDIQTTGRDISCLKAAFSSAATTHTGSQ